MDGGTEMTKAPRIVSVEKIWDRAPHSAFTDLIRFGGRWWCTFRDPGLWVINCPTSLQMSQVLVEDGGVFPEGIGAALDLA